VYLFLILTLQPATSFFPCLLIPFISVLFAYLCNKCLIISFHFSYFTTLHFFLAKPPLENFVISFLLFHSPYCSLLSNSPNPFSLPCFFAIRSFYSLLHFSIFLCRFQTIIPFYYSSDLSALIQVSVSSYVGGLQFLPIKRYFFALYSTVVYRVSETRCLSSIKRKDDRKNLKTGS
jgi:hypothetical protein